MIHRDYFLGQDHDIKSPAVLHIGCGTSDLSNQLRQSLLKPNGKTREETGANETLILNVDFASGAIETSKNHEREKFGNIVMQWHVVDILERSAFESCCFEKCGRPFDVIVEKSYLDALACGEELPLVEVDLSGIYEDVPQAITCSKTIPRQVLAALYLGSQTRPGGAWIALSYSSGRFDFLKCPENIATKFWMIENVQKIPEILKSGPDSSGRTVYRPEIAHYLYTLRRKSVLATSS